METTGEVRSILTVRIGIVVFPGSNRDIDAVNARLTALGHDIIYGFTHEVQRLPNGQTVVNALTERTVCING